MDGPRDSHTEWSKSEREKHISYNITYIWDLEKWYRWIYSQSRKRDTDIEKKHMDTKGVKEGWNELGDRGWHKFTTDTMYITVYW